MDVRSLRAPAGFGAGAVLLLAACAPDDAQPDGGQEAPDQAANETDNDAPEGAEAENAEADPPAETEQPDGPEGSAEEGSEEDEQADEPEPGDGDADDDAPESDPQSALPPGGGDRLDDITTGGEPTETFYSDAGQEVGVAGLDPDDAPLPVRAAPTGEADLVAELGPLDAVLLAGREWHDPQQEQEGSWTEIELEDGYGWVESNLRYFGGTDDVTSDFIDDVPPAQQSQEIAESVVIRAAQAVDAGEGEQPSPEWVMISSPDDFGENFYRADITGMPDDSVAGERLFITVDDDGDGYELAQVERTLICQRGVTDAGLCI